MFVTFDAGAKTIALSASPGATCLIVSPLLERTHLSHQAINRSIFYSLSNSSTTQHSSTTAEDTSSRSQHLSKRIIRIMLLFEVLLTLVFVASTIVPIICHLADGPSETETETKTKTETKRSTDSRHFTPTEYWAFLLRFLKPDQLVEKGAFRLYQMAQYLEINGFLDSNETFSTRAWATLWTAAVTVTYKRPYTVPTSIDDLTDSDLHFCKKKVVWEEYISDEDHEVWKFWGADKFESLEDFFRLEIKEWVNQETIYPRWLLRKIRR